MIGDVHMRSVEVARRGPRPPIRIRPVPRCDPPFDDELEPQVWATAQQLAFDLSPQPRRALAAPVPPPVEAPRVSPIAGASGDARLAVRRFVSMCVEVLNGYRPAAHLRRLSLPTEAAAVVAQGVAGARRVAELRRAAHTTDRRARRPGPVAVIGGRLCEPRSGAVEAAVLLVTGERTWAMALRLELRQQTWAATFLRLI
jgi:hypothetical protein